MGDPIDQTAHPPEEWKRRPPAPYGQNVAWGHAGLAAAAAAWFAEHEEYSAAGLDPLLYRPPSDPARARLGLGPIGHFTAMAAARTGRVGCSTASGRRYPYRTLHVCNYSPPGNMGRGFSGQGSQFTKNEFISFENSATFQFSIAINKNQILTSFPTLNS